MGYLGIQWTAVVELSGAIDQEDAGETLEHTLSQIQIEGVRCVIFEMSRVININVLGLMLLSEHCQRFTSHGLSVSLVNVPENIRQTMDMLGLAGNFDIQADFGAAIEAQRPPFDPSLYQSGDELEESAILEAEEAAAFAEPIAAEQEQDEEAGADSGDAGSGDSDSEEVSAEERDGAEAAEEEATAEGA